MSAIEQGRVDRARERLESAARDRGADSALRIVKINAPVTNAMPLQLDRKFSVVGGLSQSGLRTLYSTIDGMRRDASADAGAKEFFDGIDLEDLRLDNPALVEIVDRCDEAIMLAGAEIRGATLALKDLDEQLIALPDAAELKATVEADPVFAEFVGRCIEVPEDAHSIRAGLEAVRADSQRVALEAACEFDIDAALGTGGGSTSSMLFGRTAGTSANVHQVEAEGELSEYDMAPGSPAYVLAARLDHVGIPTSPLDAVSTADRLLRQVDQAVAKSNEFEGTAQIESGSTTDLVARRDQIRESRLVAEQRVESLQTLRTIALDELSESGFRFSHMPIMFTDPFADIPISLLETTLTMLGRRSESSQVIVATDIAEARQWCANETHPASFIRAEGWFATEHP